MNSGPIPPEWYYLLGKEVRGPVSLAQLSNLMAARIVSETVMVASKGSSQWRPAGQVLNEYWITRLSHPDLPPQSNTPPAQTESFLDQIGDTLSQVAGTEKLEGFSLQGMFSETFKKRTVAEMEEYLIVGTARTTPKIAEVETGWPKPWLFARFLLFFGVIYIGFVMTYKQFHNPSLIPGLILIGAFAMPIATLILFFELNTPRNVSLYRLMVLVGLGGIVSLFISLIGYNVSNFTWLGASGAGIIEELGKLATLILIIRNPHYKYILNGMLFGAAVGAGFAAFESAGYAFRIGITHGSSAMMDNIALRGGLAPLMHVAWTAMVGAALWRVKKDQSITLAHLSNPRFLRILFVAVILHMLWDSPFYPPFYFKEVLLGSAAWFIIWGLVQQGLRQVRDEQREAIALLVATLPTCSEKPVAPAKFV
jgi:protease PrsW